MVYYTDSAKKTEALGQKIGFTLKKGDILALFGQLGGGKTTFLKGVAKALKIKERIVSPTFIICRRYQVPNRAIEFCHYDWYRIENEKEALQLGVKEEFLNKNSITAIEWAEKAVNILPKKKIAVYFKYGCQEGEREIKIIDNR